jgi:ABC-2 type transport system permease protein
MRVSSAWPVWLSPIGWGQQTRPFGGSHWWPLVLAVVAVGLLLATAVALAARRDVGRGLWPERRGHASATRSLLGPVGLVWRLQRGAFIGWAVALTMFGLIFGSLTEQIQNVEGGAGDWWTEAGGTDQIVDAYRVSIIQMAGMFVAVYVVQVLLRLHSDEAGGTLEPVLATHVSRWRWLAGSLVNAVAGATALMLLFATCMSLSAGRVLGDTGHETVVLSVAALAQLPGVLVLGAMVVAAVGLLPRAAVPASWLLLVASLALGPMFGPGLGLPPWLQDLSPFTHLPKAPANPITATPLVLVTTVCLALVGLGLLALRRRDLALPA